MSRTVVDSSAVTTLYSPNERMPLFIQPRDPKLRDHPDIALGWFKERRETFDDLLAEHGALVFRGFAIPDTSTFGSMIGHYKAPAHGYTGGMSSRAQLAERVFEATNMPPDELMFLHQEMAYLPEFPAKVAFWCAISPVTGGQTLLVDMRKITADLPDEFLAAVEEKGVLYRRQFRDRSASTGNAVVDTACTPWQHSFATDDPDVAVAECRRMGMECEWQPDGTLNALYRAPGIVTHSITGERVFFNQIAGNTPTELTTPYYKAYQASRIVPSTVVLGDGTPIKPVWIERLQRDMLRHKVEFPWSSGDLLLIDNILVSHGRNPYTGLRNVQVALLA